MPSASAAMMSPDLAVAELHDLEIRVTRRQVRGWKGRRNGFDSDGPAFTVDPDGWWRLFRSPFGA
jgi:hypothetical protein